MALVVLCVGFQASSTAASPGSGGWTAEPPPLKKKPPTISGPARQGRVLTARTRGSTGSGPQAKRVVWQRCNRRVRRCRAITGATKRRYVLTAKDVGSRIRFAVRTEKRFAAATTVSAPTRVVEPTQIYWGAWIGPHYTGIEAPWDETALASFETLVGKKVSLINFSAPFADCASVPCSFYEFDVKGFDSVRRHGAIPFFSWGSQSTPSRTSEPDFQLGDVVAGTYDSYIAGWADAARRWGHPFFLRFNWEMNGNWMPWSEGVNGNAAGEYVAAWRHVHDIFTTRGATNVTWVWCPYVDDRVPRLTKLRGLYPGGAYVDWTCLDGYNYGRKPMARRKVWRGFDRLYRWSYHELLKIAPSKPMIIGEVASSEYGGSKAAWIRDMLAKQLPARYPLIKGILYFDKYDSRMDWPVKTSSAAAQAFGSAIASPYYASNQFGSLGNTAPIAAIAAPG